MNRYIGHPRQLFEAREYIMAGGKAAGVRAVDVWNGAGLHFTVLADRCLDLYTVRYKNRNMSFLTPTGVVAPEYYDDRGAGWLRSFAGGFLTTCGLQNIGIADNSDDTLSMHGRIANTPAENLCVCLSPEEDAVEISGIMREGVLFGAKLKMERTIKCRAGADEIELTDVITNLGYERVPISMLYHFNIGYPLLSETAEIVIPAIKTDPRDEHAKKGLDEWDKVLPPQPGWVEMCYYHTLSENTFGIDNPAISTRMRIYFESDGLLDRLVQWRQLGEGDYVTGLEPASCTLDGRADAVANGSQKYIDAGGTYRNHFKITFSEI